MNPYVLFLIVYSVAQTAFGLWIARRVRASGDFFVAGRRLGPGLMFSTVLAANIGAGSTVGATGLAYQEGLSAWWWNGSAGLGSLVLAFWIGPKIWREAARHNFYTVGDYLERRYGASVRGAIAALTWLGTLFILAGQLIAGAAVLNVVAGVPMGAGALIGGVVMTIYFTAGGLLSSAWVNAAQLVVLLAGFMVALPMILSSVGGIEGIRAAANLPAGYTDILHGDRAGSGWTLLGLLGPAFVVSPGLVQKAYGGASARAVKIGIGTNGFVLLFFAFVPALLGMAARARHADIASANLVLPTLFVRDLPAWLGSLGLAAVFSAEVSTCDAILFMLATSLSQDLYKRFVNRTSSDRQLLLVARLAAVGGGALGVGLAIVLPTVISALTIFYSLLGVSLFVPLIGGLYSDRAGVPEALASIGAGVASYLGVHVATGGQGFGILAPNVIGLLSAAAAFGGILLVRSRRGAPA